MPRKERQLETKQNINGVGGNATDDSTDNIPSSGKTWIDKHLCPYYLWGSSSRKNAGKFYKYNCTVNNMEHIAIAAVDRYGFSEYTTSWKNLGEWIGSTIVDDIYAMLMDKFFSALSVKMNYTGLMWKARRYNYSQQHSDFPIDNYVFSEAPTSYVTIDYHNGKNGPVTGSLKIVVIAEEPSTDRADTRIFADNGGFQSSGIVMNVQKGGREAYYTITQTDTCEYPVIWRSALHKFATWYYNHNKKDSPSNTCKQVWNCETEESR